MRMRIICACIIGFLIFYIPVSFAATSTGFVQDSVWFSTTPIIADTTVVIYEAVSNGKTVSIDTTVQFEDKNVVLGTRDITILPGAVQEVSIIWIPTAGTHEIMARILSEGQTYNGRTETIPVKVTVNQIIDTDTNGQPLPKNATEILAGVELLQQKISSFLPSPVVSWISSVYGTIEQFRLTTATFLDGQKSDEEATLQQQLTTNVDTDQDVDPETTETVEQLSTENTNPFSVTFLHGKIYGYTILSQFFYHKVVFYGACILILFMTIRALIRRIH